MIHTRAWTGGDKPAPYSALTKREKYLVSELFREQVTLYKNRWNHVCLAMLRTFWKRARYDAHETMKGQ